MRDRIGDLISRKALVKELEYLRKNNPHTDKQSISQHNSEITACIHRVLKQPTAYNVDKVVEQLEENQTIVFSLGGNKPIQSIDCAKAIEIVKGGGVDE